MKAKGIITVLLALCLACGASAQKFEPRQTWPYLLEEFTLGSVRTSAGVVIRDEAFLNVSIPDGRLHYIQNGKIMAADMTQVYTVLIGKDVFMNRGGRLEQVLYEGDGALLLKKTEVDMVKLSKSDIGYGVSSATASTQKLTGLGAEGMLINMDFSTAIENAKTGEYLPLDESYSFLVKGKEIPAKKADFLALEGLDPAGAKAFLKEQKIKWNKPLDLVKVLDYITANLK